MDPTGCVRASASINTLETHAVTCRAENDDEPSVSQSVGGEDGPTSVVTMTLPSSSSGAVAVAENARHSFPTKRSIGEGTSNYSRRPLADTTLAR